MAGEQYSRMNFAEFKSLCETDQLRIALDHYPIANRKVGNLTVLLNKVDDFFVEIHFNSNSPKEASIEVIESFNALELYWERVNIQELTRHII